MCHSPDITVYEEIRNRPHGSTAFGLNSIDGIDHQKGIPGPGTKNFPPAENTAITIAAHKKKKISRGAGGIAGEIIL